MNRKTPAALRVLYAVYRAVFWLLCASFALALAALIWYLCAVSEGRVKLRQTVELTLPEDDSEYVFREDDPYYQLYGKDPMSETPAPTPSVKPTAAVKPTATVMPTATMKPTASPAPTPTPVTTPAPAAPTPTPIPNVDGGFVYAREVIYRGERYQYKENVATVLLMGIDEGDPVTVRTSGFGKGNQTDTILLAAVDMDARRATLLSIPRDTMTEVSILSYDHKSVVGRRVMQLALAHAYGDGAHLSCRLASTAVASLLGGLPINGYCSINYGAVPRLNDRVGGVEIAFTESMTIGGVDYAPGDTARLFGADATEFVRDRSVGMGTNLERMDRQRVYIAGFLASCAQTGENPASLVLSLYDAAGDYLVTSLSRDEIVYLGTNVLGGGWTVDTQTVPGELRLGEIYEFYPDASALTGILLDIFYQKD